MECNEVFQTCLNCEAVLDRGNWIPKTHENYHPTKERLHATAKPSHAMACGLCLDDYLKNQGLTREDLRN